MPKLKISLINDGVFSIPCSTVFIKHIEGMMCQLELNLNKRVGGKLETFYKENEKKEDNKLSTKGKLPCEYLHIINFHKDDLPFTYLSVDRYARRFFQFAIADPNAVKIATTIHGPGAGLDSSESMEVMLEALADEFSSTDSLGNLQEILFIERDSNNFGMLQTRVKYLQENKGLLEFDGNDYFLLPVSGKSTHNLKKQLTKTIFVAMPFSDDFDDIYWYGIKRPIEKAACKPEMLKHEKFSGDIIERIKKRIEESELVIADITGNRPNIFYEIGYAHALNKKVIFLSQDKEIPFDIITQRNIFYLPKKIKELEQELKEYLDEILSESEEL
jgi:hypothetical protein